MKLIRALIEAVDEDEDEDEEAEPYEERLGGVNCGGGMVHIVLALERDK